MLPFTRVNVEVLQNSMAKDNTSNKKEQGTKIHSSACNYE